MYVCEQKNLAASVQGIAGLNKTSRGRKTFRILAGARQRGLTGGGSSLRRVPVESFFALEMTYAFREEDLSH